MAIKEETYSRPCPVHGQLLTSKRTKTIRTKAGERYTKPIFYCARCKAYYIIVDEFSSDFKQKSLADSGTPIYIVGKQKEVIKTNEKKQDNNKKKDDKHTIKNGVEEIRVIPKGDKLPKKCLFCEKGTQELIFKIKSPGGGKRELRGKWCPSCGEKFFSEELYKQHSEHFRLKVDVKPNAHQEKPNEKCLENGEMNIGTVKENGLLDDWLDKILTGTITEKHKAANNILINYPDSINDLKNVVDQLGLKNFKEIVMEMVSDMGLVWPDSINANEDIPTKEVSGSEELIGTKNVMNEIDISAGEEKKSGDIKEEQNLVKTETVETNGDSTNNLQKEEISNKKIEDVEEHHKEDAIDKKKKKFDSGYNGPEVFLEAYQLKKCIVCGHVLNGDQDIAWVQCNKCKTIYCEESYKHIFSEPVVIVGKKK